jgi:hypothetical protein
MTNIDLEELVSVSAGTTAWQGCKRGALAFGAAGAAVGVAEGSVPIPYVPGGPYFPGGPVGSAILGTVGGVIGGVAGCAIGASAQAAENRRTR